MTDTQVMTQEQVDAYMASHSDATTVKGVVAGGLILVGGYFVARTFIRGLASTRKEWKELRKSKKEQNS